MAKGVVIAAPSSGSGKTLVTLGLLRALKNRGRNVISAKAGPDYIDPAFHAAATGLPCINLDLWAMGAESARAYASQHTAQHGAELMVVEGVMGLFDGPHGARGSTADLAEALGFPVVLVVDAARQGQSIAALAQGFRDFRTDISIAGVILNRVSSDKHEAILRAALEEISMSVFGALRQIDSLTLPSRHLGLVQAQENQQLEAFIERAAARVSRETNIDKVYESGTPLPKSATSGMWKPLAQTIAVARDEAFSFTYEHVLEGWRQLGAQLSFFSPLADEAPPKADAIFLPGGYPELHAGKLAANARFMNGLRQHKGLIYGECGGYMVLGDGMIDAQGQRHAMAGLLPLTTSFAQRRLHLGYRQLDCLPGGPWDGAFRGHEFHYSTIAQMGDAPALFRARDAAGHDLGPMGQRIGQVMGSYAHIISRAPAEAAHG